MIGQTISHYRILEKIGEGGMGVVYRAEDLRLHRMVALKFPAESFVGDAHLKTRFLNEARMSSAILHQNVAVTHDIGEVDGKPFIVMEFVDGVTLRRIVHEEGPLSLERFIHIAVQICSGLGAVHEEHLLHRDIKSENILLTAKEQVKIADCGLAARFMHAEGFIEKLGIAGTTAYMSPEQGRGDCVDPRSDLFSLGVVFYEILAGHLPFEADHPAALLYLIANASPAPLAAVRPDLPPSVTGLVHRLLEKDPSRRYQTVGEVLSGLMSVDAGL